MKHFQNVTSLEDLKKQFETLAGIYHPVYGSCGYEKIMEDICAEYDYLFPIWKHCYNLTADFPCMETAASTRRKFYQQKGWKVQEHDRERSIKEVVSLIRAYVKEVHPAYRFRIRSSSFAGKPSISVKLVQSPEKIYKSFEELTVLDRASLSADVKYGAVALLIPAQDADEDLKTLYERYPFLKIYRDTVADVLRDVDREVYSYKFEKHEDKDGYSSEGCFYYLDLTVDSRLKMPGAESNRKRGHRSCWKRTCIGKLKELFLLGSRSRLGNYGNLYQ